MLVWSDELFVVEDLLEARDVERHHCLDVLQGVVEVAHEILLRLLHLTKLLTP